MTIEWRWVLIYRTWDYGKNQASFRQLSQSIGRNIKVISEEGESKGIVRISPNQINNLKSQIGNFNKRYNASFRVG